MNGELEEEVYIEYLDGFPLIHQNNMVSQLKKALYALKQASRAQQERLDKYLLKLGFSKGIVDNNLYFKVDIDNILIVEIFEDDIIICGNDNI